MLLIVNLTKDDLKFKYSLGKLLPNHQLKLTPKVFEQSELLAIAAKIKADGIILANPGTLKNLVSGKGNLNDWRGSVLKFSCPVLVINPLSHVQTIPYGQWLLQHDLKKLSTLKKPATKLAWTLVRSAAELRTMLASINPSDIIICDIETTMLNQIDMIGYSVISSKGINTFVVPFLPKEWSSLDEYEAVFRQIRTFHKEEQRFCFHNGAFDNYQLLRYGIATSNYILDTEYLWYCWQAELPKSLDFLASFFLFDAYYWKEQAHSESRWEQYEYNAKDCLTTARVLLALLNQIPDWALANYYMKFPEVFSAIQLAFYGVKIDTKVHATLKEEATEIIEEKKSNLQLMTGEPDFNPGSYKQVAIFLYSIIGAIKPKRSKSRYGTDEVTLKKIATQHPLVTRVVDELLQFREQSKAVSTYYNAILFHGRLKYNQQIDGTTTSRWAAHSSSLYVPPAEAARKNQNYGTQIMNIPPYFKKCMIADPGYRLGEIDKEQADARSVAYLSKDAVLKQDLETPGEDFYCKFAFRSFGSEIEKSDPRRQLMKKTVHGTNFMMGVQTFIDTNGVTSLREFMRILKRPSKETLTAFVKYVLGLYHSAYPNVKVWWDLTKISLIKSPLLTTADGWTRHFHGDVVSNHKVLRDAVAHQPQHLTVYPINKGMIIAWKMWLESKGEFIPLAQIHDSIFFEAVEEKFDSYAAQLKEALDMPIIIHGQELRIPTTLKEGKVWSNLKSKT